jgi:serine/threonine-protein kinase
MDAAESTLVAGYRLDRYELLCPIASGGMASVWLARLRGKRGFAKLFAIKTIKTELISDQFQEMFLDEARIASRIIHPNVAQVLELGEQDEILYIVMEWVDGDSLAQVTRLALKSGSQIPLGVSLRIVADVCAGLHAAHQLKESDGESLGVVHRDVSPQNILLTTEGNAKVIDFGLVKARNRTAGPTDSGIVKGKIRYMAPEQLLGKPLDRRADVWAAGMCLYELVVGHLPYHDEDDLDVIKRLMSPDPLPAFDVTLPAPIERVLERALVADPEGRFDTCASMKRAIEAAISELGLNGGNDDVAELLSEVLPELAAKRAKTVAKALEAADARSPEASDDALPLTRRRSDHPPELVESEAASKTTSATSLRAQLGERRKRGWVEISLAALVATGVGAWILWPRSVELGVAPSRATPSSEAPSPSPSPSAPLAASSTETIELDLPGPDGGTTRANPGTSRRLVRDVAPADAAAAAPPAPTYNPAYSILTNPPEAGMPPPIASAAAPSASAPPVSAPPEPARPAAE